MLPDCGHVEVRWREGRRALYISIGVEDPVAYDSPCQSLLAFSLRGNTCK